MNNKTPLIILSGFLGAGKTTLLRNLLQQAHQQHVAISVIVNDMSTLDVDGVVIANTEWVSSAKGNFVTIAGCSISSPQGMQKLAEAIEELVHQGRPDLIILETSGASHPLPLVEYLQWHQDVRLTSILTVVDASMLAQDYANGQQFIPALQQRLQQGCRATENLLAEQIMFSSQLLLSKHDKVSSGQLQLIAQAIHPLNPYVAITAVSWGNLSLDGLLNAPAYDFQRVSTLIAELREEVQQSLQASHNPQQPCHQVIADDRPFHPQRLWDACHHHLGQGIYRSKGFFWLPTRDDMALLWNQAAGNINLELISYWKIGVLAQRSGKLNSVEIARLQQQLAKTKGRFGDRRCQLTVIGEAAATAAFCNALTACFLTDAEIEHWQAGGKFADPWPQRFAMLK
ncbi:CobW family GTP-binding protein [Shewanella sp. YIC-542]|uniref:CobW family GTP-binding protein n=1 Tax=Shewanella mytili TaxID=3377111 RepID=UPI00398E8FC7